MYPPGQAENGGWYLVSKLYHSRNLWIGWCVSSWRHWFWSVYSNYNIHTIHYSCIISNLNKLFLKDMHSKSWCCHTRAFDDSILLLFSVCFHVYFQLYSSVFSLYTYEYRYHVALYTGQQHPITVYKSGFGVCVILVLSVIRYSCYYFLDIIIFPHDFHHDGCDYHWDFYGHWLLFELHFRLALFSCLK